jgi:hypothetical protein
MLLSVERPFVGAFAFVQPGATLLHCERSGASSPAGVGLEHGKRIIEVPQELGRVLLLLLNEIPAGDTGLPTPGLGGSLVRRGANITSATEVPPSEGNEARRDGRQEVVAL